MRLSIADQLAGRRSALALLALALGTLAIAGCGGSKSTSSSASTATPASTSTGSGGSSSSSSSSSSSGNHLSLAADPEGQLAYTTKSLTANAGKVSIDFTNMAPLMHNMTIESSAGAVVGATPTFNGGSKTLTLDLKPGTYKFFCSVPGHRQAGMEGTLVVK